MYTTSFINQEFLDFPPSSDDFWLSDTLVTAQTLTLWPHFTRARLTDVVSRPIAVSFANVHAPLGRCAKDLEDINSVIHNYRAFYVCSCVAENAISMFQSDVCSTGPGRSTLHPIIGQAQAPLETAIHTGDPKNECDVVFM